MRARRALMLAMSYCATTSCAAPARSRTLASYADCRMGVLTGNIAVEFTL
jgi:hypothetical protein